MTFGDCTHKPGIKKLFQVGKATLFAGSGYDVEDHASEIGPKLIVALDPGFSINRINTPVVSFKCGAGECLPRASAEMTKRTSIPVMLVDWKNGGWPPMGIEWWKAVHADIQEIDGPVVFCCIGGHGRTGAALVIMAVLEKLGGKDPISWIRNVYCQEAVETKSQMEWLTHTFGFETRCKPRDTWSASVVR